MASLLAAASTAAGYSPTSSGSARPATGAEETGAEETGGHAIWQDATPQDTTRQDTTPQETTRQDTTATHPPADSIAVRWGVETNELEGGGFRSALTITNEGAVALEDGWALYFNFSRPIRPASLPEGVEATHVNGDFWRLASTAQFAPLAPGAERHLAFEAGGSAIKEGDAPAGLYFVFGGEGDAPAPVGRYSVEPFATPEQTSRGPADRVEVPTPERRYRANADLRELPPEEAGRLIPTPVSVERRSGTVTLRPGLTIYYATGELEDEAASLAASLEPLMGARPRVALGTPPGASANAIALRQDSVSVPGAPADSAAAYTLVASQEHGVEITGASAKGVFYGIQSLRGLLAPEAYRQSEGPLRLRAAAVRDAPRFGYRGLHLDVARNFQTKAAVKDLLDLMATYKLDTFHFHLTDDEGWRLAIGALPELTEVGGRRGHPAPGNGPREHLVPSYGSGPDPSASPGSGFYSRGDFIELLQYAQARHIRVIPEIDVPGHARAAIVAMEARYERLAAAGREEAARRYRLQAPGDTSTYQSVQGWRGNVIDVCQPSAYRFMETVVGEIQQMYDAAGVPLRAVHVGGDEVPAGAWEGSPACQSLLSERDSLGSAGDLQRYFFKRLYPIFAERDLVMGAWEEAVLTEGGVEQPGEEEPGEEGDPTAAGHAPDPYFATRQVWPYVWNNVWGSGREDNAYKLANAGYEVVMAHASNLYLDMSYSKDPEEPGLYWAGFASAQAPFAFAPFHLLQNAPATDAMGRALPDSAFDEATRLTEAGRENILGLQGQLWGETLRGPERLEYSAFPRLLSLAERAWAPPPAWATVADDQQRRRQMRSGWNAFANRLAQHALPRLDARGTGGGTGGSEDGVAYRLPPPGAVVEGGTLKANAAYPGLTIRYTTDGSVPGASSPRYTGPVEVGAGPVKLRTFDTRGRGSRTATVER